tara:strand:- start:1437 stop:1922 length:486 start_codon:yes stop_codon:yes gene_type:complete
MHYLVTSIISGIGWGIIPILDRYSSRYLDGLTLASTRGIVFGISAIMTFLTLLYLKKNKLKEGVSKGGKLLVFLLIISPIIGFFMGQMLYYVALSSARSSIIQITLISFCLPVIIVAILSNIVYKDEINTKMVLGILLTLIGISITVIYNPNYENTIVYDK